MPAYRSQKKVSKPLELDLQLVVSCLKPVLRIRFGFPEEQQMLLNCQTSLQPLISVF